MTVRKKSFGNFVIDAIIWIILGLVAAICILPMWHVFMSAISDPVELYASSDFLFLPIGKPTWDVWKLVFDNYPILRGYLNTILYTLASTSIGLALTLLGAYVLAQKNFMLSGVLMVLFVIPMFFNAGLMPQYVVNYKLGITDTPLAVILPTAVGGLNILLVRTGIRGVADSYAEAAELDGAGHFTILIKIIVPLIIPYISMVIMFSVIMQWNSWMLPKIYLSKEVEGLWPLALVVNNIVNESKNGSSIGVDKLEVFRPAMQMITILLSSLPLLIIYPFIQKYFEKAVIVGGVKG